MDLNDILRSQGGIDAIASQLGITRDEAERGAQALMPAVLHGLGQSATGGADLDGTIENLGGAGLTRNVVGPEPTEVGKGNDILGQIFGSKQVSRDVAGHAAQSSGVDPALLKKMLPILAMLVAGYLSSKSKGQGGGLGSVLGPILGSLGGGGGLGGGLGGILGSVLGGRR